MANHPNRKQDKERAVVVTTQHKGVFFGYAADVEGEIIKLRAGRNCLFWSRGVKGFIGLASEGPDKECRVGPSADIQIRDITSVVECTPAATQAWEAAPWSR